MFIRELTEKKKKPFGTMELGSWKIQYSTSAPFRAIGYGRKDAKTQLHTGETMEEVIDAVKAEIKSAAADQERATKAVKGVLNVQVTRDILEHYGVTACRIIEEGGNTYLEMADPEYWEDPQFNHDLRSYGFVKISKMTTPKGEGGTATFDFRLNKEMASKVVLNGRYILEEDGSSEYGIRYEMAFDSVTQDPHDRLTFSVPAVTIAAY